MQPPSRPCDWSDRHTGVVSTEITSARQAFETSFARLPKAVDWALRLRDAVVGRLGLARVTDGSLSMTTLPVLTERPDCYEVGLEDKHLTFTLQTDLAQREIAVTTRIWFNHWTGRLYLAAVLLPHKLIVRRAIRSLA